MRFAVLAIIFLIFFWLLYTTTIYRLKFEELMLSKSQKWAGFQ